MANLLCLPGDQIKLDGATAAEGVAIDDTGGSYATVAGVLRPGEGQVSVQNMRKRYLPRVGDCVVGSVVHRTAEFYKVDIRAHSQAILPALAFNGATKRMRPQLDIGCLVYARIEAAHPQIETQLTCVDVDTKKAWTTNEIIFGEMRGGLTFEVPLSAAERLLDPKCFILERLGKNFKYEVCVGHNGRVWLQAASARDTVMLMTSIKYSFGMADVQVEAMVSKMCENLQ